MAFPHYDYKPGHHVRIVDEGKVHPWYQSPIGGVTFNNARLRGDQVKNRTGRILAIDKHRTDAHKTVALIELTTTYDKIVMNVEGILPEKHVSAIFKLGEKVQITNADHHYSGYTYWKGLKGRTIEKGKVQGRTGKIVEIGPRDVDNISGNPVSDTDIYLIETPDKKYILMGPNGIERVTIEADESKPTPDTKNSLSNIGQVASALKGNHQITLYQVLPGVTEVKPITFENEIRIDSAGRFCLLISDPDGDPNHVPLYYWGIDDGLGLEGAGLWRLFLTEKDAEEVAKKPDICPCCKRPL